MKPNNITRRNLLLLWRRSVIAPPHNPPVVDAFAQIPPSPNRRNPLSPLPPLTIRPANVPAEQPFVLRPPGALPEALFETTCEHCGRCIEACPAQAISPIDEGPLAGTPHIDPVRSPCVLCTGLKCTHNCPCGALQPLTVPDEVRIGIAQIDAMRCTAYRGLPCRICYEVCPVPGVLTLARGERAFVPVAGESSCVGCGLCQHHCPAEGAIRIVPRGDDVHGRMRVATPDILRCAGGSDAD